MNALLAAVGLPGAAVLTAPEAARYLGEPQDGLAVPRRERIASAAVAHPRRAV